jgi:predicted transcriptional regulator
MTSEAEEFRRLRSRLRQEEKMERRQRFRSLYERFKKEGGTHIKAISKIAQETGYSEVTVYKVLEGAR